LRAVRNDNAKGEYYLTDLVGLANADGKRVVAVTAPYDELRGVNSRAELAAAEAVVQRALRAAAMAAGVTLVDPDSVFLSTDTAFAPDVTVEPNVYVWRPARGSAPSAIWKAAWWDPMRSSGRSRACAPARFWSATCMWGILSRSRKRCWARG
jgi:hypothetical protein